MNTVTDTLETMIIMALEATHSSYFKQKFRPKKHELTLEILDQGILLRLDEMLPSSTYSADMTDPDRIFSSTPRYLVTHPADILGDESEVMMFCGEIMKWFGYRRLRRVPKNVYCLGRATHWYEAHIRFVAPNGAGEYFKRIVPLDRNGRPLFAKVQGHGICDPNMDGVTLILCASIIEDAHRANAMLASVRDANEIKFPIPLGDYKEVFSMRDGPMNGNRKKAIIHWVSQHMRHSTQDKEFVVKKHTRGIQEFSIDGLQIKLTPNR